MTVQSCTAIDTCERDIATDFANVSDVSDGYGLSSLESHRNMVAERTSVICELSATATDALHVTDEDLLHVVSNSHVTAVSNCSQESFSAAAVTGDMTATTSPAHDMCNMSPSLRIGQVGFKAKLRVNVATLAELELWQKDFAERSKTTMRYANVSICTGKKTLYKVSLIFTARQLCKARYMPSSCVCVCVCHTPVLYNKWLCYCRGTARGTCE